MPSLADRILATGCALHAERIHSEPISILSGPLAGRSFRAVVEVDQDVILTGELGEDPRPRRLLRFLDYTVREITRPTLCSTEDGRKWTLTKSNFASYLSHDFVMIEVDSAAPERLTFTPSTPSVDDGSNNIYWGAADPNGNQIGSVGDEYNQIVDGSFVAQWIKTSGAGTNTGWE